MKIKYLILLNLTILLCFNLQAKEIYYGTAPELVRISKETIFRFHKQVRTISQANKFEIKPADPNDPDYSVLSIKPRFTKGNTKVAFVLSDGSVATLNLVITRLRKTDDDPFYDVRPKSALIERSEKNLPVLTVMDFMKSVDMDSNIIGYKRETLSKWLSMGFIHGVSAKLIRRYSGKDYKGYVIELRNRYRTKKYKINVEKVRFKDSQLAIISMVDDEVIVPSKIGNSSTLLKVVAKSTATIGNLQIPVSVIDESKGENK